MNIKNGLDNKQIKQKTNLKILQIKKHLNRKKQLREQIKKEKLKLFLIKIKPVKIQK